MSLDDKDIESSCPCYYVFYTICFDCLFMLEYGFLIQHPTLFFNFDVCIPF